MSIDIVQLIERNPLTRLSKDYQSKFINQIKEKFLEDQQKMFVSSFYCYLNYNQKNDFVIDFESVWKWLGFSRKGHCKTLLEKHFIEDIDYKINKDNIKPTYAIGFSAVAEKPLEIGGRPIENILLTVNTFKKLCLKSNTKKADEIHDYFIKLENILQEIVNQESHELKLQLQNKDAQLQNVQTELKKTTTELKREKIHKNKIMNRKYYDAKPGDVIYLYKDDQSDEKSLFRIGKTRNISGREQQYNNVSRKGVMKFMRYCLDCDLTEKLLHHLLDKYRVNAMHEWFELPSESFGIETINTVVNLLDNSLEEIDKIIPKLKQITKKVKCTTDVEVDVEAEAEVEVEVEIENNAEDDVEVDVEDTTENIIENIQKQSKQPKQKQPKEAPKEKQDPLNFDLFISECCEVHPEFTHVKVDIKQAHRIWSKCCTKTVTAALEEYLETRFKSGIVIENDIRRNIYRGVKLLDLKFLSQNNPPSDYENFISDKCKPGWAHRISYFDFFNQFIAWKRISEPDYELEYHYKKSIQKYLEEKFAGGRVYLSGSGVKSTHLFGIWGLGMSFNNFGLKEKTRSNKLISQYDTNNNFIQSWDSLSAASRATGIRLSTLSVNTRFETNVNGYIYKYDSSS